MVSDSYKPGAQHSFWHTCLTKWCVNSSDDDDDDEYLTSVSVLQRNRTNYTGENTEAYRSDAAYLSLMCGSHYVT